MSLPARPAISPYPGCARARFAPLLDDLESLPAFACQAITSVLAQYQHFPWHATLPPQTAAVVGCSPGTGPPGLSLMGVDPICQTGVQKIAFWSKKSGYLSPRMADLSPWGRQVSTNIAYNGVFVDTCFWNGIWPGQAGACREPAELSAAGCSSCCSWAECPFLPAGHFARPVFRDEDVVDY